MYSRIIFGRVHPDFMLYLIIGVFYEIEFDVFFVLYSGESSYPKLIVEICFVHSF